MLIWLMKIQDSQCARLENPQLSSNMSDINSREENGIRLPTQHVVRIERIEASHV